MQFATFFSNMTLTDTDKRILALLKTNARISTTRLAQEIGVSRATIQKRLQMLEKHVILGYSANISPEVSAGVRAWTALIVDGTRLDFVLRALAKESAILRVHSTNGKHDLLIEIESATLGEFDQALDRIRSIDGVKSSETNILLSTLKG